MNLIELQRALRQLRLGGTAAVLETRLRQAQAEAMAPIDLISCLVSDELTRRSERLLDRRRKQAAFRDPHKSLDNFDFNFNPKMNRSLVFDLATCAFIGKREDALFITCEACACKTGGFQESKFNYFNDLQELRCILIRLSIRAGTGIEPFKTKAYTGGREIGFGGLVPIRSRWPQVLCAVGGR